MRLSTLAILVGLATPAFADRPAKPPLAPEEFLAEAKELLIVGACAEGTPAKVKVEVVAAHCAVVRPAQETYKKTWLDIATPFFKATVPREVPKTVVYPFSGGDLASALAVYPDADEITTLSLEPAGDARALDKLTEPQVKQALKLVATELAATYQSSFSKTMSMIQTMRDGALPTQLVFSLSALRLHGYEPLSLRYFKLDGAGNIVYLTSVDVARLDRIKNVNLHNAGFGNVELRFKKPGSKHEQVYRHIMANLDNAHLKTWRAPLRHLAQKGRVAGMTKAASYLLSYGDFSMIRDYLIAHVDWMVSDTTGVPPSYGTPAGFDYETWGDWKSANMNAGNGAVRATWKALFATQPKRKLDFRFGYPNGAGDHHLVVMKRRPEA